MKNKLDLDALLLSVVCMMGIIVVPFINVFHISSNANLYVLIIETIILSITFLKKVKNNGKLFLNPLFVLGIIFIIISYIRAAIIGADYSIPQLALFCIIPLMVSTKEINVEKFLKYCIFLSVISLLNVNYIFKFEYEGISQASMGNSYSVYVSIVACIFYLFYYKKNITKIMYPFFGINIYLATKLLMFANRGTILGLFLIVIFLFISKYNNKTDNISQNSKGKNMLFVLLIIVGTVIAMNIETIMIFFYDFFIKVFGDAPSFLIKSSVLSSNNNLTNNRNELYLTAINLIKNKPFLGYGIETFSMNTIYPWPHNLILQFIYEGGIIFSVYPIFLILKTTKELFFSTKILKNDYVMGFFLFFMVFPRYFVSNDIWKGPFVWLLLGFCMRLIYNIKKIKEV